MDPESHWVSISMTPGRTLEVALTGEIDFSNSAAILAAIRAGVLEQRPVTVRVDLAAVTFLDSSGIGVLVNVMKAAHAAQAGYRVEHPSPKVHDQLRITGLLEVFGLDEPSGV